MTVFAATFSPQMDEAFPEMNSIKTREDRETFIHRLTSIFFSFNLGEVLEDSVSPHIVVIVFHDAVVHFPHEHYYEDCKWEIEQLPEETRRTVEMMLSKVKAEKKDMIFSFWDL